MIGKIEFKGGWAEAMEPSSSHVKIGDRLIPRTIRVYWPGGGGYRIPNLSVVIDSSSGVPRCTEVHIEAIEGGREIRPGDLRGIDVDDVIEKIVPYFVGEILETRRDGSRLVRVVHDPDDYRRDRKVILEARRSARRKITPELLAQVAEAYNSDPDRPAKKVEQAFGVRPRTAYRYISEARKQGLLAEKV